MLARIPFLPVLGYGAFFMLAFVLFTYWTFPYERAAQYFAQKLSASHGYRIQVEDVDPYWLTGVEVEDAHIHTGPDDELGVHILEGRARASLFTVLGSAMEVDFDIQLATGSFVGSIERAEETAQVKADLKNVRLEMFPMIAEITGGLPLSGAATGKIDVRLHDQPDKSEGMAKLTVKDLRIGDGKAKLEAPGVPALTVDPVDAGDLSLDLTIADGVASLNELAAKGEDLELSGSGEVRLGKSLGTSRPNVAFTARFTEAYKTKTPRTEAMFSLLEGSNSRQLKRATTADGAYAFTLSGSLSSPRFTPGKRGGGARKIRGARRRR